MYLLNNFLGIYVKENKILEIILNISNATEKFYTSAKLNKKISFNIKLSYKSKSLSIKICKDDSTYNREI